MIHAVLIFNTHGKPRLSKFYTPLSALIQQSLISQIFSLISDRPSGVCNFLDAPDLVFPSQTGTKIGSTLESPYDGKTSFESVRGKGRESEGSSSGIGGKGEDDTRVIYRHYATLYFVFVVDGAESELGILDLIQVFVESLDRAFENVCELDLIFHFDDVHHVLSEIIQGGLVLETNIHEITACAQNSLRNRKASSTSSNPLIPSLLTTPSFRPGRSDGGKGWLSVMGV
ncbi:hypothetical protein TREMEDRAFT_70308 [Tremella mesenterica DSM 1558]|uniref:uncharacterized protein n=1 Tax=Tremella mesenterica (strain ATCC 24925 / CBS 8224 / DSM 1558 / NBRC 9311 / NRRL Y-6157 / RJB 2259-6 / UBC 559-6) TaxID=578456 RepID=UPI00032D1D22|nr:uncharacterized protein TREMEDRAFT_70308 [Tremella mesenterica DSM 1558]EIW66042.1 hypothetical protein TREMEDRAFT_70308 [Tremella mesenterica DSM 1558]